MSHNTNGSARGAGAAETKTLRVNGKMVAYTDQGHGQTVLLLHCNGSSRRQWHKLIDRLSSKYRVLAPDIYGHGDTPFPQSPGGFTENDEIAIIDALLRQTKEPFHLVGHSYGGAIALRSALTWKNRLLSLTLIEPALFELLREAREADLWKDIADLAGGHISLVEAGEVEAAGDLFMSYWIGAENWRAMPPDHRDPIKRSIPAVAIAWEIILRQKSELADYASLGVPTTLLMGSETKKTCRRVVELLGSKLPHANLVSIQGAGHMSPITHPDPVNAVIEANIVRNSNRKPSDRRKAA